MDFSNGQTVGTETEMQKTEPGITPAIEAEMATPRSEEETLAARRKTWFEKADCKEKTKRDWRFSQGIAAGYAQAAEDYTSNRLQDADLENLGDHDIRDYHALGFRVGYLQKLAEILVF